MNSAVIYMEEKLSDFFGGVGLYVAVYPARSILLSLAICFSLLYGTKMIEAENSAEVLYSPSKGNRAREERDLYRKYFPTSRKAARYSQVVLYSKEEGGNLLDAETIGQIRSIHEAIVRMEVRNASSADGEGKVAFKDVCQRFKLPGYPDSCKFVGVVELKDSEIFNLPPTWLSLTPYGDIPVATFAGGRETSANGSRLQRVEGWKLYYQLSTEVSAEVSNLWENSFLDLIESASQSLPPSCRFKIAYEISRSSQMELSKSTSGDTILLVISFVAVSLFAFVVMHSFMDRVASKGALGLCACLSVFLAIGSAFGLMGYCRVKYNPVVAFVSFLLLGLGVDDSFVLVQAYHYSAAHLPADASVQQRMFLTFKTAGTSIFFTSITDFIAFAVGASSSFPAVQGFCAYAASGVILLFVHQLLFFGAFMALDAHREYCQLSWWWLLLGRGVLWSPRYDSQASPASTSYLNAEGDCRTQPETAYVTRFAAGYGAFLLQPKVAALVLLGFAGYLGIALYGAANVGTGLDLRDLASSDSYWTTFVTQNFRLFNSVGPLYTVAVPAHSSDLSVRAERDKLLRVVATIEDDACFLRERNGLWLRDFNQYETNKGVRPEDLNGPAFKEELRTWLEGAGEIFQPDFVIDKDKPSEWRMLMSRFRVRQIPPKTTSGDKTGVPCLKKIRSILDDNFPHDLHDRPLTVDVDNTFVFFEASAIIVTQTILNLVYAAAACFLVTVIIIPHPILCVVAMIVVSMILVGTLASMTLISNLRIETISMIDLVLAIGFSIDNVAHYIHAFMSSRAGAGGDTSASTRRKLMAIDALERIGMPILAADLSTMIALLPLVGSKSRIFASFFSILFTVLFLGGIHAVVFLPVFLGYFGPVLGPALEDKPTTLVEDQELSFQSTVQRVEVTQEGEAEIVIDEPKLAGEYGSG
ncbi:hypothetical protein GUITHDRAFT_99930 [Guillardia theta CCMP2712]|uniref:SSD domain-containing protein n=2 Tax=Guillardia theta TaxID=55529 RepID=L1K0U1_GUITC|nr:hypothetical protein GUITHDRAFT_99930 [Guillardia theta CCMP2712]EKX54451.1 hypothetical protein GUITHDRAFT_99930 [Guillardia theta CCMP2712]|eukprot:XP_005841431.1 hypothetical protein GUITHDRAFT_99930 [Guillardia theta CCMP2712]